MHSRLPRCLNSCINESTFQEERRMGGREQRVGQARAAAVLRLGKGGMKEGREAEQKSEEVQRKENSCGENCRLKKFPVHSLKLIQKRSDSRRTSPHSAHAKRPVR
mmetsp:Transcript_4193/g.8536  ORF Transcript_4193/g.8536 Transcript_4193/m.8536 type:complete len:106 (+) Transcript_4193:456-773(+)